MSDIFKVNAMVETTKLLVEVDLNPSVLVKGKAGAPDTWKKSDKPIANVVIKVKSNRSGVDMEVSERPTLQYYDFDPTMDLNDVEAVLAKPIVMYGYKAFLSKK